MNFSFIRNLSLLVFALLGCTDGAAQQEQVWHIAASGEIYSSAEWTALPAGDAGTCVSDNGLLRGVYGFREVGFDNFSVSEFRLFSGDSLLGVIAEPHGMGFYLSNCGVIAAVTATESLTGKGSVTFYSPTGQEFFSLATLHARRFKFSGDGKWFGVVDDAGLHLVQPESRVTFELDRIELFDFSDDAGHVAGCGDGRIALWTRADNRMEAHPLSDMPYVREIAISPDGEIVAVIARDEARIFPWRKPDQWLLRQTVSGAKRYRDVRLENERILLGVQERERDRSRGTLEIYNVRGELMTSESSDAQILPHPAGAGSLKKSLNRDEIHWPFAPFDSVYSIGNSYEEYQNYGGDPYPHPGVDLMAAAHTPVYAVSDGVVKAVLTISGSYHWRVAVGDSAGPERCEGWLYAHLDRPTIAVAVGDVVYAGDCLGQLVPWPSYSFTHLHFVKVEQEGDTWTGNWDVIVNALEVMRPNSDSTAPMFFNTIDEDRFAFCYNESNIYLPADNLNGQIDIIARVSDFINDEYWQCAVYKLTYWIRHIPADTLILQPTLAAVLNHRIPNYTATPEFTRTLYKDDFPLDTKGDYNYRIYYHILTNNDGDALLEDADRDKCFDTAQFPDGPYRIYVQAEDAFGNSSVDSMNVVFNNGNSAVHNQIAASGATSIFRLSQNCPNPFNSRTVIRYQLEKAGRATVSIYNVKGQRIITLLNQDSPAGQFEIVWDGADTSGRPMPSGLYFYSLETRGETETRKMLLLE
ncbi:MAG: FlgD immunoglobulin-like domain containing protein [Candidatus Zhuqueibacterota bacterium]